MPAFTKLMAVNRILRAGGEHPVNTLASTSGDSLMAESLLDEVNYEVQSVGMVCNTEVQELTPNSSGNIQLPDNILHIEVLDSEDNTKMYVQRGTSPILLYNVTDQSYTFTENVTARLVLGIPFEELPFATQMYIADETAQRYQMITVGDGAMDQMLRAIFIQSRARGRAQDIRSRQLNLFGNMQSKLPFEAAKRTARRYNSRWGARRV